MPFHIQISREFLYGLFPWDLQRSDRDHWSMAKNLSVTLDVNLTYNHHVNKTVSTCMSILGQINRVKHAFDKCTLITIIKDLVFNRIYYRIIGNCS